MSKYYIVVRVAGGRSISIMESDNFDYLEEKLENILTNTNGNSFFPLSRTRSSRFINMDRIDEIRIENYAGEIIHDVKPE